MTGVSLPRWCPRCSGPVEAWHGDVSVKLPTGWGWAEGLVRCLHCGWALARALVRASGRSATYEYWQRCGEDWRRVANTTRGTEDAEGVN